MNPQVTHSLRARLLGLLLGAISLASVIQGITAYSTALAQADVLFDRHMQKMASSLRNGVPLGNAQPARPSAQDRESEDFVIQVWSKTGIPLFQSAAHRNLRQPAPPGFSTIKTMDERIYRVYSLSTPTGTVQVAQDMADRHDMATALASRAAIPSIVMAPLLMLMVWMAVSRSLAPISAVRAQMSSRKVDDLSPVNDDGLPEEVQPLIQEINLLFGRVRRAFEAQRSFVADAAHELRSPLAALKLQVQGLQRATDDAARELGIKRLSSGIDRASHMVEQLLALARQEASANAGVPLEPLDLAQVGMMSLTDCLLAAQSRQIDLGVHRAEAAPIKGHTETLRVLFRNLLDNAIKYTPSGGTVDLDVGIQGDCVVASIEDSGLGIPEADRTRVLDRFYRLHHGNTEGSGLGLAIVKTIAELHGAQVTLDTSPRLGGLRVQLSFPLARA